MKRKTINHQLTESQAKRIFFPDWQSHVGATVQVELYTKKELADSGCEFGTVAKNVYFNGRRVSGQLDLLD